MKIKARDFTKSL